MAHLLRCAIASTSRASLAIPTRACVSFTIVASRRALHTALRARADEEALAFHGSSSASSPTNQFNQYGAPAAPDPQRLISQTLDGSNSPATDTAGGRNPNSRGAAAPGWGQPGLTSRLFPTDRPAQLLPTSSSPPNSRLSFPSNIPFANRAPAWQSITSLIAKGNRQPDMSTAETWKVRSVTFLHSRPEIGDPSTGRQVLVQAGNVARAYGRLMNLISRNSIRAFWTRDQRFESPSVRRYRLRSQRHRARFAENVREKVQLVQKIMAKAR